MKKKIFLAITIGIVAISGITNAFAWSSSLTNKDFEKGSKYSISTKPHEMYTSFVTEIKASRIAGSKDPVIRQTIEYWNTFMWTGAKSTDSTISQTNKLYQGFWTTSKKAQIKATWKQTNEYANMTASLMRIWDNS